MPEAARASARVARRRTGNWPAALNVVEGEMPVAGAAPPSESPLSASPLRRPGRVADWPAFRLVGALPIVPFGSDSATLVACDVMRLLLHAEKGMNWLDGMVVPLIVTARVC